ncbi:MAG: hypothetical protein AAF206_24335, partial [Bacteroidota bacterium]
HSLSPERLLNMVIHLELENFSVLRYEAESTARYLRKRGINQQVENELVRFFRKMAAVAYLHGRDFPRYSETCLTKIRNLIDAAEKQPQILLFFDFESWLESKVKSKKLKDVYKISEENLIGD